MKHIESFVSKYWLYILISLLFLGSVGLTFYIMFTPQIKFNKTKIVELNSHYSLNDYKATYLGKNITDDIRIAGKVDSTKIGQYKVTYTVIINNKKFSKRRNIKVVDTTPPVITLVGRKNAIVCPSQKYIEDGYKAMDSYDGNLTDKVKISIKKKEIMYSVSDSSGNKTKVKRFIDYKDITPPTIILNGSNKIYKHLGVGYNEPGFTATDNCDLDITSKVKVSGDVNVNKLGTYQIKYEVTDSFNFNYSVVREIVIINKPNNIGKTIYLTFDDGPGAATSFILDVLKDEDIKATFFVTGANNKYNNLIKRAYEEGHGIGLHCYSHNYAIVYASDEAYFKDLNTINSNVKSIIGADTNLIRFPGGSSNVISKRYSPGIMTRVTAEITRQGYTYFDWNVASADTQQIGSDKIYNNVISGLSAGLTSVVLMHDGTGNWQTANTLSRIIKYGKEMGYSFSKITDDTPVIHHNIAN